ncbi:MAG: amidohydrolase, partial [Spirochaetales bacterium]|nr:amidohydrolase [Spirochaetales bacterium]
MGIVEMARGYSDYAIRMRREFHMHPEPSMKEFETQKRIMAELDSIGIPYVPAGGTGVVATIRGGKPGKTVALRADIDALELAEENDVAYKSTVNGMMHACGHDGHAASLLAAAKILTELSPELVGTVKLIFQPGEENGQGAFAVISSGTLDDVDAFFGLHLWNYIEAGAVSVEAGPRMASAGVFSITIQGKGGHGSMPDQGVDAALVGAATLMNLQSVVSREISPLDPAVLSIGVFRAGTRFNVLAGEAYLEGTTRCFSPIVNSTFKERIQRVVDSTASAYRAEAVLDYKDMVQPTINDPALSEVARRAVEAYVGADRIVTVEKTTGGEDFS